MSINFFCEEVILPDCNYEIVSKVIKSELRLKKLKLGQIGYIFCSDEYLLGLNKKYLNHDYYTDVITFDYSEIPVISGDVFISVEMVLNNSVIFGQLFEQELIRVISHGFLHLLGYKDKESEDIKTMRSMESLMMNRINSFK